MGARVFTSRRPFLYYEFDKLLHTLKKKEGNSEMTKLNRETEAALLSNWFSGRHREDIHDYENNLFNYPKLRAGIVEGKDFSQLLQDGQLEIPFSELNRASGDPLEWGVVYKEARTRGLLTQLAAYAEDLVKPNGTDKRETLKKIEKVQALLDGREYKPKSEKLAENFLKDQEERRNERNARFGEGFTYLDKKTDGINRGQLIVLAARPAAGKSAAALQIGSNVARQGYKTLFLPLEMTTNETLERMLYQQQVIEPGALKAPRPEEKDEIRAYLENLEERGNFIIYEGLNELEGIRKTIKEEQPYLVIIDQLTQIKPAQKSKDIRERYTEVTSALKAIAIEEHVAIILLTQLNREATRSGRPNLENLHEADSTGQNADVVLILTKGDESERVRGVFSADLYIAKHRQGESDVEIPLTFLGNQYKFAPVETWRR